VPAKLFGPLVGFSERDRHLHRAYTRIVATACVGLILENDGSMFKRVALQPRWYSRERAKLQKENCTREEERRNEGNRRRVRREEEPTGRKCTCTCEPRTCPMQRYPLRSLAQCIIPPSCIIQRDGRAITGDASSVMDVRVRPCVLRLRL